MSPLTTLAATAASTTRCSTAPCCVALPIALLGGLVSFFSPCVLPLVPGYLSYVTGVAGTDLAEARRGRMVAGASLFVLGFTAVFVSGGALFGYFGDTLQDNQGVLSKVLGALMILDGCLLHGADALDDPARVPLPHAGPPPGWPAHRCSARCSASAGRPCIGPTLASVDRPLLPAGQRGPRRHTDRRLLPRPRCAVRARRGRLPQGARRLRLGQAPLCLGDADRRRR